MFRRIVSANIKKVPLSGRARSTRAIKQVTDTRPTLLDPWEPLSRDFEALEGRLSPRNMLRGLLTPLETTFDQTPPMVSAPIDRDNLSNSYLFCNRISKKLQVPIKSTWIFQG